ncbi:glutamate racemase [Desulfocurvibacter africanus]|uniref:Glutamate racemase n=1 Tax=Desulfocurvibacter africanus subsp. africanus str. Walvis Bay TaxID=690850 RepID=F3YYR6_DESAF|nr:glutamate racemase [Desulfocurvibacter africanus]EGJ51892.1 Glutamate racemase [Desulfocurvibacter africanus subsp. africanus str. Walvis Bay]
MTTPMNTINNRLPIGVFDSGVGGLTVLRALRELLPGEDFRYLGDTARLPYGTKSRESVVRYALQSSRHLVAQGVKLLVVACNTATAAALPDLAEAYPGIPVVGVVRPGARAGCALNTNGRIAVMATESTVQGGAYQAAIRELCPNMRIEAAACSLFVALAEEGWTEGPLVEGIVKRYLDPLFARFEDQPPTSLVLGCTHFPMLAGAIAKVAGEGVTVIDSAVTTAQEVRELLVRHGLGHPEPDRPDAKTYFFATDGRERFARVGSIFLRRAIDPAEVTIVDL